MMERAFSGFAALPNYSDAPPPTPWWKIFEFDQDPTQPNAMVNRALLAGIEVMYRTKAKTAHPDQGGSEASMTELNAAIAQARLVLS